MIKTLSDLKYIVSLEANNNDNKYNDDNNNNTTCYAKMEIKQDTVQSRIIYFQGIGIRVKTAIIMTISPSRAGMVFIT